MSDVPIRNVRRPTFNLKNASLAPIYAKFLGKSGCPPLNYLRNRSFCPRSIRQPKLFDPFGRFQENLSLMMVPRQMQQVPARAAGELARQDQQLVANRLDVNALIFLRQTQPLEPVHYVAGQHRAAGRKPHWRSNPGSEFCSAPTDTAVPGLFAQCWRGHGRSTRCSRPSSPGW